MKTEHTHTQAAPKFLKDYQPTPYARPSIDLRFDIQGEDKVVVTSTQRFVRRDGAPANAPLVLDGEHQTDVHVTVDGKPVSFVIEGAKMSIENLPASFELQITSTNDPAANSRLEGLYASGGSLCTQCEAEGFRNITYTYDRPDVLGVYTVRIEADKTLYPVLLSNGNNTQNGDLPNGRHFAVWHDPYPKPCYLFALVAGDLEHIHDTFTTRDGRRVDLRIFVRAGDEKRADFAMRSLKKSMKWDEDAYGRVYDLDVFNIVAVSDFNFGAMENKSLNIFNAALVLADLDTATDADFVRIETVVGHEYFHNWSGNRVTCRDWFQVTLKEGFTTLREEHFCEFSNGFAWQRINDVNFLRQHQFTEDAGPMAHPIRPESYVEINNFYTPTVYEKGAEVIRMMATLLGEAGFRKGCDLYFDRHDGEATTCENFVKALEDANGADLSLFWRWYTQSGTPTITASGVYDAAARRYTLKIAQRVPTTTKQPNPLPLPITIVAGLVGPDGQDMSQKTLFLTEPEQNFVFDNIDHKPVPSLLRGFSAPVHLQTDLMPTDLRFLMVHDNDGVNRWEACQSLAMMELQKILANAGAVVDADYLAAWAAMLEKDDTLSLKSLFLALPSLKTLMQSQSVIDPHAAHEAHNHLQAAITAHCKDRIIHHYERLFMAPKNVDPLSSEQQGRRALKNLLLDMLLADTDELSLLLAERHYDEAPTMTERVGALGAIASRKENLFERLMHDFYERYRTHELALNKWFSLHVSAARPHTLGAVTELTHMEIFNWKNPNRVRAVFGALPESNPTIFHDVSGQGYQLVADAIIKLNETNPMVASRLFTPFRQYKKFRPDLRDLMENEIKRITQTPHLAADLQEVVGRTLEG